MSYKPLIALSLGIVIALLIVEANRTETPENTPQSEPEDDSPINIPAD